MPRVESALHATAAGERFAVRCSAVAKEFKGKDIEKGVAVPTCISINKQVAALPFKQLARPAVAG